MIPMIAMTAITAMAVHGKDDPEPAPYAPRNWCNEKQISTQTDGTGTYSVYERYEFPILVQDGLACLVHPCTDKSQTHTFKSSTADTSIKTVVTESTNLTGGLIPLFKFLTGTSAEWKKQNETTTTSDLKVNSPDGSFSSGQRVDYRWAKQFRRETEDRSNGKDSGSRGRTQTQITGYRGHVMGYKDQWDECTDVITPVPCKECPKKQASTSSSEASVCEVEEPCEAVDA